MAVNLALHLVTGDRMVRTVDGDMDDATDLAKLYLDGSITEWFEGEMKFLLNPDAIARVQIYP
jgi:hypothetical protein